MNETMGGEPGWAAERRHPPSPVPTDAALWPDELPFTAFGQFGLDHLDLRVFDQSTWWVDRTGTPHQLTVMSGDYRRNVIRFLEDQDRYFQLGTSLRFAIQAAGDAAYGLSDPATSIAHARHVLALTPRQWLDSTVLMRSLRAGTEPTKQTVPTTENGLPLR